MNIFGDDSEQCIKLTINKKYAENYDSWRRGEELQKLKDKYGDGKNYETDTETSSSEDENAKALTKEIEKSFFKTLSSLKGKDPRIYDKSTQFFDGEQEKMLNKTKKTKDKDHFYSIGEYQRSLLFDKIGKLSDEESQNLKLKTKMSSLDCELKKTFKDVLNDSENENDLDEWGGLFKKRVKTQKEINNEEEDYKQWLAGEKKKLTNRDEEKELKGLHDYWNNPDLDDKEIFLRDYILNKRFLDQNKNTTPAYDEICESDLDLSADENTLLKQDEFEKKYNFRFQEPDQDFIKRYPRTMEHSMRKKDEKRKKKRDTIKKRKEAEKAKKAEELKRLKALKKKEILDKIKKLQEITGNSEITFQKDDLEGDFNPTEHDQRMSELFNENYYGSCFDEEKPECPELDAELDIENWDNWNEKEGKEENDNLHCEDPNFNMDCDYDPTKKQTYLKNCEKSSKKNKRKQSRFAAAIAKEKPLFNPADKSFEKYVDEYYSLDYEDLIGDLPCRFKYRKVVPNDFGLSIEEILAAPDKELNSWVSVKKIIQRRPQNVELYDVQAYKKKAKDINKKRKCLPSLFETLNEDKSERTTTKHEIDKNLSNNNRKQTFQYTKFRESQKLGNSNMKKRNKNLNLREIKSEEKWTNNCQENSVNNISNIRLKSYGINPKKFKNKLKYKNM